jgi:hypothetical protein
VLVLSSVHPAEASAQMWFFPDVAYPASTGSPDTWVSGTVGRGLNDVSGIGLHVSADVLFRDTGSLWYLGVGIQWNAHALREAFR